MATKRNYITISELEQYANISVTDEAEAYDVIEQAEEIIDQYVGPQARFLYHPRRGEVTASAPNKIFDTGGGPLNVRDNYYVGCELEIIGGTGLGEVRTITASNMNEQSITYDGDDIEVGLDTAYLIRQVGKFPRQQDASTNRAGTYQYKTVPEAVKRAVAAQVAFMIAMGNGFFASDQTDKQSESIGNYSYSKGGNGTAGSSTMTKMVAPIARTLLRGYKRSGGRLIVDNPTWQ